MNANKNLAPAETITAKTATKDAEFHNGKTSFRRIGRKWHFTAPTPDGKTFTFVHQFRGGFEVANRVAPLFEKDVTRLGRLGGQRANILRLIEAAN